jgi:hypothetical protein
MLHSCAQYPQTKTTITMSSRCGTVETRRARPTAFPHPGHLRSTFMMEVARGFNPSSLILRFPLTEINERARSTSSATRVTSEA